MPTPETLANRRRTALDLLEHVSRHDPTDRCRGCSDAADAARALILGDDRLRMDYFVPDGFSDAEADEYHGYVIEAFYARAADEHVGILAAPERLPGPAAMQVYGKSYRLEAPIIRHHPKA